MLKISKILRFRLEVFHSGKELYQGLMETFAFLNEPKATTDLELTHIAAYRRGAYAQLFLCTMKTLSLHNSLKDPQ
nr:hypothetical protein [Marinobacter salsuginis]